MNPSDLAIAYVAALSSGDPERVAALVSDDFVNEHASALGTGSNGRSAYRRRLDGFFGQFRDLTYHVVDTIADGGKVAVRYRMTAVHDGHPIDIPGVMLIEIRDGLITHRLDVWDSLTFLHQTAGPDTR